ncbi:MAG: response regulator [Polyangiales bacterium]
MEDDCDLREVLLDVLADAGYHAVGAANGLEALRWLREAQPLPSAILLDLMMPIMDGWHFREEQLKDPLLAAIPVATLSATRNVAMDDVVHLKKPVDLPSLHAFAARHCVAPSDKARP